MKPLSPHWADQMAARIVRELGDQEQYVVASGITPSGVVHIGNFREEITVDLVARALRDLGKQVRFIHSWDSFDTFRKVPANLPNQEGLKEELRRPISRIPDPYGKSSSYAHHAMDAFEEELAQVGIDAEFLDQEKLYSSGQYAEQIRHALQHRDQIVEILNEHRTEPLAKDWLPTDIYCSQCQRDQAEEQKWDGDWGYSYKCKHCGHAETVDIRKTNNLKLGWRIDWPMRWAYEKVDFEPGGKDHSSQGGSFDTGQSIVQKVWNRKAPMYLQYDFVMCKGLGGKMSSSKGNLITLSEAMEVYDPQMIRWIFANQRPNHDFSLAFDQDVIKVYDEFDRAEIAALGPEPAKPGRWPVTRRTYELSLVEAGKVPSEVPFRPPFRDLCNRLQICGGDIDRAFERFYQPNTKSPSAKTQFEARAKRAWKWLEKYAPDEFRYRINSDPVAVDAAPAVLDSLVKLKELVAEVDLDNLETKEINQLLYDRVIHQAGVDSKDFYNAAYRKLISREQGPRLPSFLKEIGKERLLAIL